MTQDEKRPLLAAVSEVSTNGGTYGTRRRGSSSTHLTDSVGTQGFTSCKTAHDEVQGRKSGGGGGGVEVVPSVETKIERNLGLGTALLLMISCCCGTAIFVSPVGVTQSVGSVGVTLCVWVFCGLFSMVLALCYAELGTAIPVAGGDYAYIQTLLGPFPAFLCLWMLVVLVGPAAATIMGLAIGEYFTGILDLQCHKWLALVVAFFAMFCATATNMVSVKWSARIASMFSLTKVVAMGIIIVVGFTRIAQGETASFEHPWEGSRLDPLSLLFSIVPGFVTYAGWDIVNAMAEDMKNPKRDIPLAAVVGLIVVTVVYFLVNVAYFSVLTPEEFLQSDVVAASFSAKALPGYEWIVPLFVILSATGSLFNIFLIAPRWTFAGGRNAQLPVIFSYIHVQHLTCIPALILLLLLSLVFTVAGSFFSIQEAVNIMGLVCQVKIAIALVALVYMKLRLGHKYRGTIQVPLVVVIVSLAALVLVTAVSIYSEPVVMGGGFLLFLGGVPLYWIQNAIKARTSKNAGDGCTIFFQKLLLVVPEKQRQDD